MMSTVHWGWVVAAFMLGGYVGVFVMCLVAALKRRPSANDDDFNDRLTA